jgi:hypothetical protein
MPGLLIDRLAGRLISLPASLLVDARDFADQMTPLPGTMVVGTSRNSGVKRVRGSAGG